MDKPKATPKDFFLWAGAVITLYIGVFNYIALVWDYINYSFPNPLAYYYSDPYQSGISFEMATLIVIVPTFLLLMWVIRRDIARDATRSEIWVRRWALFLTLFVAGATIVGDLITVLYTFLNGTDLTTAFLLKALVVLLVASLGFMHFMADLWGYWTQYPARNRYVVIATAVLVVGTIVAGFFIVGTPGQARMARLDTQRVYDLQNIQSQVLSYWQRTNKLPVNLAELNDPLYGFVLPKDPQTQQDYGYRITKPPYTFEVCANFDAASSGRETTYPSKYPISEYSGGENWQHVGGGAQTCFERTINPAIHTLKTPPLY